MRRLFLPFLLLLLVTQTAFAQRVVTDDEVNEVSKGLYCPVCESEPLDTCGTQACIDWRAEIRAQLEQGRTEAEIYADFVARYGERVLAQPSARGLNLILWLGLPVLLLVGGYFFVAYMRSLRVSAESPSGNMPVANPTKSDVPENEKDDYLAQIESELQG